MKHSALTLFSLMLISSAVQAAPAFCAKVFSEPQPGYDVAGQPLRRAPVVDIRFEGEKRGRLQLQELVRDGAIHSHPMIAKAVLARIEAQGLDVQLGPKDTLLMLDVMGDRGAGLFRLAIEGMIHSKTLDILGIDAAAINYSTRQGAKQMRVVVVIRENLKDYREGENLSKIETREQAVQWLGQEIGSVVDKMFDPHIFNVRQFPESLEKAYEILSPYPAGIMTGQMSRTEFDRLLPVAFFKLFETLPTADILYMRRSFWDAEPKADAIAVELFHYLNQGGRQSLDPFVEGYPANALRIREQLYNKLHRSTSGARPMGFGQQAVGAETTAQVRIRSALGGASAEISGISPQQRLGLDFFNSRGLQYTSLKEAFSEAPLQVQEIAAKLERAGLVDVSQMSNFEAIRLTEQSPFLTVREIETVALELADMGVYMQYASPLFFKMELDVRREVSPPKGKVFGYSPRINVYIPGGRRNKPEVK